MLPAIFTEMGPGCESETDSVAEQLLASVTVTVYVPPVSDEISSVVSALLHIYVYGVIPDETVILIAPSEPEGHEISDEEVILTDGPPILAITDVALCVHKFPSVTVTVYVPGARLEITDVVFEFDHKKVKPPVPPDGLAVMDPSLFPQVALFEFKPMEIKAGWMTTELIVEVHRFASVNVTV